MATKDRPLASMMTQVVSDLAYLLQTEIRLARAEIGEKLSSAANAGIYLGIAAVLMLSGVFVLLSMQCVGWRSPGWRLSGATCWLVRSRPASAWASR